ncbi:MAG: ABC transporter ATP-binding protein [Actinomycetota bacterium]|nr:ABC transporter ATP-binding protein [Actinomycetota bacterium]
MSDAAVVTKHALAVEDLRLAYKVRGIPREVLRGVSFHVRPGEAYGLVGESGCGKSTTAYAALRYLPANGVITDGRILVGGADVTRMSDKELRRFRAREASMVYQDAGAALNPTVKIGRQVAEAFTILGHDRGDARQRALAALNRVRIADPERVMQRYPHQLSGGMQQRVVIAMALACDPQLLVLDEPTTGLDATVEAEVLDLVRALRSETDSAILLIAHNLGVIRSMCDRVGVMYAGRIVEEGDAVEVFEQPKHPYTIGMLECLPRHGVRKTERALFTIPGTLPQIGTNLPTCVFVDRCALADETCRTTVPPIVDVNAVVEGDASKPRNRHVSRCHHIDRLDQVPVPAAEDAEPTISGSIVITMTDVSKTFRQHGHDVPALVGIRLDLGGGETLGLVGESGSGKTTLAKAMLGIHEPDAGSEIKLDEHLLAGKAANRATEDMRAIQMVFQNPDSALNRAWTVRRILLRTIKKLTGITGQAADTRLNTLTDALRLSPRHLDMRPRQLSGGLKQRVAIARAFAGDPRIVVCDEPTSALDVSVQAAILNLLSDLQSSESTSYLFISHDLGVVRYLADRIVVMYLGRLQEEGTTDQIFNGPHHPYTEALLSAVPSVDGEPSERIRLIGEIPSPANPPSGCVFHTRCHRFMEGTCDVIEPPVVEIEVGHRIRCHLPIEELERTPIVAV